MDEKIYFYDFPQSTHLLLKINEKKKASDQITLTLYVNDTAVTVPTKITRRHSFTHSAHGTDKYLDELRQGSNHLIMRPLKRVQFGNKSENGTFLLINGDIKIKVEKSSRTTSIIISRFSISTLSRLKDKYSGTQIIFNNRDYNNNLLTNINETYHPTLKILGFHLIGDLESKRVTLQAGKLDLKGINSLVEFSKDEITYKIKDHAYIEYLISDETTPQISSPLTFFWKKINHCEISFSNRSKLKFSSEIDKNYLNTVNVKNISIGDNWITATDFIFPYVAVSTTKGKSVVLYGPSSRFKILGDAINQQSQVIYYNNLESVLSLKQERYYGLRLPRLMNNTGVSTRLDCNWGVVKFNPNSNNMYDFYIGHQPSVDAIPELVLEKEFDAQAILTAKIIYNSASQLRVLNLPVDRKSFLQITDPQDGRTPFQLITDEQHVEKGFTLLNPALHIPPMDMSANRVETQKNTRNIVYDYWRLKLPKPKERFTLSLIGIDFSIPNGTFGDWEQFEDSSTSFELWENPKAQASLVNGTSSTTLEVISANENQRLAYKNLELNVSFENTNQVTIATDQLNIDDLSISESNNSVWLVYQSGIDQVLAIYSYYKNNIDFFEKSKSLIQKILPQPDYKKGQVAIPTKYGISILLWRGSNVADWNNVNNYWAKLASVIWQHKRGDELKPGIIIDFSNKSIEDHLELMWGNRSRRDNNLIWDSLATASPQLWPYKSSNNIKQNLDPSAKNWNGRFFNDLPVTLPLLPEKIANKYAVLADFYKKLNEQLALKYGWHDNRGWTFHVNFKSSTTFTVCSFPFLMSIDLISLDIKCTANQLVQAGGQFLTTLKFLDGNPEIKTDFSMSYQDIDGVKILLLDYISADLSEPWRGTENIPGFTSVKLNRLSTDLKSVNLSAEMKPDAGLRDLLGMTENQTISTLMKISLSKTSQDTVAISLPHTINASLYGKWGLVIKGLTVNLGSPSSLSINGTINLGVEGFFEVELGITLNGDSSNPKISIERFEGNLNVGGYHLIGSLAYNSGKQAFLGGVIASNGISKLKLLLKIGEHNSESYWIGALSQMNDPDEPVNQYGVDFTTFGSLKNSYVILGRRVELKNSKNSLRNALISPNGRTVFNATNPQKGKLGDWLDLWEYNPDIDFIIGISGLLELDPLFFLAPQSSDSDSRTGVLLSSSGLIRVEGHCSLVGLKNVDFNLLVDLSNRYISAGVQTPEFDFAGFLISLGYLGIACRYGIPKELIMGLAWPFSSMEPDADLTNPDWSRALKIKWDGAFPLNTFWGGILILNSYNSENNQVRVVIGVALRAGWTESYSAEAVKLRARASLGIAVGGVVILGGNFRLLAPKQQTKLQPFYHKLYELNHQTVLTNSEIDDIELRTYLDFIRSNLKKLTANCLEVTSLLYADIWGNASVTFMGVKLAAVQINAHAYFHLEGNSRSGVTKAVAEAGFNVEVEIGCTSYTTYASFSVVMINKKDNGCSSINAMNYYLPRTT